MEQVKKYISADGFMRISVVDCTAIARDVCQYNATFPGATTFLGRAVVAGVLMAAQLAEDLWIQLTFEGPGPLRRVWVRGYQDGRVAGYCAEPQADVPLKNGRLDVPAAMGAGLLHVDMATSLGQPYRGTVHLVSGEVGDDLAFYLHQSQQIPSIVSLGVHMASDTGLIDAAGGILVELLPGHEEHHIAELESNLTTARGASEVLLAGEGIAGLLRDYLRDRKLQPLTEGHPLRLDPKLMNQKSS